MFWTFPCEERKRNWLWIDIRLKLLIHSIGWYNVRIWTNSLISVDGATNNSRRPTSPVKSTPSIAMSTAGILGSAKIARSTIKTAFWSPYRRRITRLWGFCDKLKAVLRNVIGASMTKWVMKEPVFGPQTCAKCVFRGWNHGVFRVVKSPEIGDIADYWRRQTVMKLRLLSSFRMYWTYAFVCDWIVK